MREGGRWRSIVVTILGWLLLGLALPLGATLWLLSHYEAPYVVDRAHAGSPRTAFGGHPAIAPVTGVLAAGRGATAVYPDTSVVTIVRAASAGSLAGAYTSNLHPTASTSYALGDYEQADLALGGGRVARLIRIGDTVFAFIAPNSATLEALIAKTPALQRNDRSAIGNVVFDEHRTAAVAIGLAWALVSLLVAWILIVRFAKPRPTLPPPGTVAVPDDELGRRLLALGDGTHPFVVGPGKQPGEFFVDWRFDSTFNAFLAAYGDHKLFRIRLRLDSAEHVVDSTDFQSERTISAGAVPDVFATISWQWSRGYVFVDREVAWVNGKTYRFDIREMRAPVVATITQAGWAYRPQL